MDTEPDKKTSKNSAGYSNDYSYEELGEKLEAVLQRVKDPESGLSCSRLGLVKKFRYSREHNLLYVFTDFFSHRPACLTCVGISMAIESTIIRELREQLELEFPGVEIKIL